MRILAATDFSTRSQRAVRRAGLVARANDADLVLVHVVDDDRPERLIEAESREVRQYLDELVGAAAELQGLRCRAVVVRGEPFDGILRTAASVAADLFVMGAHRKQLLRDIFVGTTVERVVRTGPYPALMVNAPAERDYATVAAAVDMSPPSADAIRAGKALGLLENVSLTYVHGFNVPVRGKMLGSEIVGEVIERHAVEEERRVTEELAAFLQAGDFGIPRWSLRVRELGALDAIVDAVAVLEPELVVIGTRGRSGILKVLLGSVTEEVLRAIDVDILAVPPRA
jgi:nucleotide-binding universal stress UspA family protein